ncbi:MAG TPA: alpha/beta hydrolase [Acidimicrobiales bacterium]|nr:alpha/beta hydrolase [Acidimicrobiales bacterium]
MNANLAPVDPQAQRLLDMISAAGGAKTSTGTPQEARAAYELMLSHSAVAASLSAEDLQIPGPAGEIPVRVYRHADSKPRPTVVFFHGGGWVIGSVHTHDSQARLLAEGAEAVVVSVDYRLAPEHPFPAALDDCTAATRWALGHAATLGGSPAVVAVAGDSAGGNLAAAVALRLRESGAGLAAQLLIYPVTDASCATRSYAENAEGYFLEAATMRWFWSHYLGDAAATAESSVIEATDLRGLPPAIVVTAQYDPLRDEGVAYAKRLSEAGVDVTLVQCDGLIHGFFGMTEYVDLAATESTRFLEAFRETLAAASDSG